MSRTILLADDSVTIQKVIELTFMDEDYEVVSLGNGSAALNYLDSGRPDIVIADVHMPGASGYDVCRKVKASHPAVPVLLLVGTFEPFEETEAEAAGADSFLKKPFDSQELMGLVKSLLPAKEEIPAADVSDAAGADETPAGGFDLDIETDDEDLELDSWDSVEIADEQPSSVVAAPSVPEPPPAPDAAESDPFQLGGTPSRSPSSEGGAGAEETAEHPASGLGWDGGSDPFPRLHAPSAADELELDDQGLLESADEDDAEAGALLAPPAKGSGRADSPTFDAPSLESSPFGAPPEESAVGMTKEAEAVGDEAPRGEAEPVAAPAYEAAADHDSYASIIDPEDPPVDPEGFAASGVSTDFETELDAPESPVAHAEAEDVPEESVETAAPAAPTAGASGGLSDDDVERIARRVVELIGEKVVHEIAWEVIPDLAEIVIKDRLQELEGQLETAS